MHVQPNHIYKCRDQAGFLFIRSVSAYAFTYTPIGASGILARPPFQLGYNSSLATDLESIPAYLSHIPSDCTLEQLYSLVPELFL